jgi:hypothetical protein
MENMSIDEYKKRSRELETMDAKKGMIAHALVVTAVGTLLTAINAAFVSEFLWCVFPIVGMTIGVAAHYIFGVRLLDRYLERNEMRIEGWR